MSRHDGTVDPVLRQVATIGLPGVEVPLRDGDGAVLDEPLTGDRFARLLSQVRRLRLAGLLQHALATDALPATADQREQVAQLHVRACLATLQLERRLLELLADLEGSGIEVVVLKGTASAHLLYPDPAQRMFGDNDLLFRSDQFDRALQVLADVGYRRPATAPRAGFDQRFGKGATLVGPDGDEVDAHRTLLFGTFGLRIASQELFASTATFDLGGREVRALGPEAGLLHACLHAALGDPNPRLGSLRDVAQRFALAQHDPVETLRLLRRWEVAPVVDRAVRLCEERLGVTIDDPVAEVAAARVPTRTQRRAIASYVGGNRSHAAKVVASVPFLDGPGTKAAWLWANLVPQRGFVRSRGGRPGLPWLARGCRSLRGGRR